MIEILYEDKELVTCVKPVGFSSETDLPITVLAEIFIEKTLKIRIIARITAIDFFISLSFLLQIIKNITS